MSGGQTCKSMPIKAIIKPFRVKSLEAIRCTKREEGQKLTQAGGYNLAASDSDGLADGFEICSDVHLTVMAWRSCRR